MVLMSLHSSTRGNMLRLWSGLAWCGPLIRVPGQAVFDKCNFDMIGPGLMLCSSCNI